MPRPTAPKHRVESTERPSRFHRPTPSATPPRHRTERTARISRRRTSLVPALAILGAGVAVTAGVAAAQPHHTSPSFSAELAAATSHAGTASARKEFEIRRTVRTSRSAQRPVVVDRTKASRLKQQTKSGGQATHTQDLASQDPRTVAQALMPQFGFSSDQFSCLDALWNRESGWNPHAMNASSGAYGIPQSLPGSKMAAAGADWQTNPATQIKWGLGYIKASYGSPCGAWAHSEAYGWY